MTEQEKLTLIEEALEVDKNSLTANTLLADLEEYDSLARLSITVMLDDEFGVSVSNDEIKAFETVADILNKMVKQS